MTVNERGHGQGLRTARALLDLVDAYSAEDFEAAEAILGGHQELSQVLRLLGMLKHRDDVVEPAASIDAAPGAPEGASLSINDLHAVVRNALQQLSLQATDIARVVDDLWPEVRLPLSPNTTADEAVDLALALIDELFVSPGDEVEGLARLLTGCALRAGPEHTARSEGLLRELAVDALAGNLVMFPGLYDLAKIRGLWNASPLPYRPQESRRRLATRLIEDARRLAPELQREIVISLLKEGMRGPADGAAASLRKMAVPKTATRGNRPSGSARGNSPNTNRAASSPNTNRAASTSAGRPGKARI